MNTATFSTLRRIRELWVAPSLAPKANSASRDGWRSLVDTFRTRRFFSEAEAERMALGPRLPHHRRHPLTADEALAGIVLGIAVVGAVVFAIARLV